MKTLLLVIASLLLSSDEVPRLDVTEDTLVPAENGPYLPNLGCWTGVYDLGTGEYPYRVVYADQVRLSDRVSLIYHPSDGVESTGGFVARRAGFGIRTIGTDGLLAMMLASTDTQTFITSENGIGNRIRSLVLYPGSGIVEFYGVQTEQGHIRVKVNGQDALIPYYPVDP